MPIFLTPLRKFIFRGLFTFIRASHVQITLKELDNDIEELHEQWDREEAEHFEYVFTEEKSDGSEAQELLGGPMRLSAPWSFDKNEPSS